MTDFQQAEWDLREHWMKHSLLKKSGNIREAVKMLGISHSTFYRWMKIYNVNRKWWMNK